jgi:hypothetical protein
MADQYGVRAVKVVRLFRSLLRSAQRQQAFGFGGGAVETLAEAARYGFDMANASCWRSIAYWKRLIRNRSSSREIRTLSP